MVEGADGSIRAIIPCRSRRSSSRRASSFLLTDIEGSTKFWELQQAAMGLCSPGMRR
jgi:hypothetical protein